jgi:4-alpha-glucanotransferase
LAWFSAHRVGFLQHLPINVTGSDRSPYSAVSSVALEPLYIDVERLPGIGAKSIERARARCGIAHIAASVDYKTVAQVKGGVLRKGYQWFEKRGQKEEFKAFQKAQGKWLKDYCVYRWLIDEAGGEEDWSLWPDAYNTPEKAKRYLQKRRRKERAVIDAALDYYGWEQWHAFSQWEEVRKEADRLGVRLMGDIPIGVSYASADVFFEPEWFHLDLFGGAPPETEFKADAFTTKWGQNWGVPVYRWDVIEKSGYQWWRRRIGALTDIFHQFRIDHILGFYRIYSFPWHPRRNEEFLTLSLEEAAAKTGGQLPGFYPREDDSMVRKAKNLLDGDKYIRAIVEAANGAEVVGEDLGTVPEYVRPHLLELDIAGFNVCHWEKDARGKVQDGAGYPECSFACYTTHDMAPVRIQWEDCRVEMEEGPDKKGAAAKLRALSEFAGLPVMRKGKAYPAFSHKTKYALLDALMRCNSRYVGVMVNAVGDSPIQINFPGTVGDQNWTYRVSWDFENIPKWMQKEMASFEEMIEKYDRC